MIKLNNRITGILLPIIMFIFIFFSGSCDNNTSKYLNRTDSLLTEANQLKNIANNIHSDSIEIYYHEIKNIDKQLTSLIKGFPEDSLMKQKILKLGEIEKVFKKSPPDIKKLKEEINISVKQLNDLRHDIENKLISKEEIIKYYNEEKSILDELSPRIKHKSESINKYFNDYHMLKPEIIEFIDSLSKTTGD
ncbi:MAG: hypothetical protein Kow0068_08830 [Marinilabiliales bacterium]